MKFAVLIRSNLQISWVHRNTLQNSYKVETLAEPKKSNEKTPQNLQSFDRI